MVMQQTPLYLACLSGHLAAVKVLLKEGADVTAQAVKEEQKLNCLDIAVKYGHRYVYHGNAMQYCQNCLQP